MSRTRILLLTLPLALGGLVAVAHGTIRVRELESELTALADEGKAAGHSFVETLRGEHAERQRVAFDRRRQLAFELAAARRNRLLGFLGVAAAGLAGAALSVMSRISSEIEEDRRHVGQ